MTPKDPSRSPKEASSTDGSNARVLPEEAITEPMLLGVNLNAAESEDHPRLSVAPIDEGETFSAVSLEIGPDDATLILPVRRAPIKRSTKSPKRIATWVFVGGSVAVLLLSVSIPTGIALGHLLTENTNVLTPATPERLPANDEIVQTYTEPEVSVEESLPAPVEESLPPLVDIEEEEAKTLSTPKTPNLDNVWSLVARTPEQAQKAFEEHLTHEPGDPEAYYGLGYIYLKKGERDLAAQHLCLARSASDPETARDVRQLIK
jgi:hypothetical protein